MGSELRSHGTSSKPAPADNFPSQGQATGMELADDDEEYLPGGAVRY